MKTTPTGNYWAGTSSRATYVALTELITRHAALVRIVCRRVLGDGPDADDAFQATFLVLIRACDRVQQPQSLAAWLYGVALRISKRQLRGRIPQPRLEAVPWIAATTDPLVELATRHDVELFDAELSTLPEKYRTPIVLHHLEGKTQREVAATLRLTEGAVDGLLKRGRTELRARLFRRGVVMGVTFAVWNAARSATASAITEPLVGETVRRVLSLDPTLFPAFPITPAGQMARQEIFMITATSTTKTVGWTLVASALIGVAGVGVSTARNIAPINSAGMISSALMASTDEVDTEVAGMLQIRSAFKDGTEASVIEQDAENPITANDAFDSPKSKTANRGDEIAAETIRTPETQEAAALPAALRGDKLTEHPISKQLDAETEMAFTDTNLRDALEYVAQVHGFSVYLDEARIVADGASMNARVNLELSGVTLRTALKLLLKPSGLDYVIEDEVMRITSKQAAENHHEMRLYPNIAWSGLATEERAQTLVAFVKDAVGGRWKLPGSDGPGGTIQWTPHGLAVRHNQSTIAAIEKLLASLGDEEATAEEKAAPSARTPKSQQPHKGEKISVVGNLDLDGDGSSDRELFHKLLREAGIEITSEINDAGQRTGEKLGQETKFLVIGDIPDGRLKRNRTEREQANNVMGQLRDLRREAQLSGVRMVSLNDFLDYIGQPKANPIPNPETPRPLDFRQRKPAEVRIEQALHEATEVSFTNTSLHNALGYIEDLHNVEIFIDKPRLEELGIENLTVNLEVTGLKLASALNLMLEPMGLDYIVKDEVLQITSQGHAEAHLELRIYDLKPLKPLVEDLNFDDQEQVDRVLRIVQDAVVSRWDDDETDNFGRSVNLTPRGLIVRHNQRTHREIENFLVQLRAAEDAE